MDVLPYITSFQQLVVKAVQLLDDNNDGFVCAIDNMAMVREYAFHMTNGNHIPECHDNMVVCSCGQPCNMMEQFMEHMASNCI